MSNSNNFTDRPDDHTQKESLDLLLEGSLDHDEQVRHIKNLSIEYLSVDVIVHAVKLFRDHMNPVNLRTQRLVDLCGTGGDKSGTFNISTTASFVVSGAGIPVAKHGNVSITSKSGSIDVLKGLGVYIPETPTAAQMQFEKTGLCFLYAPYFHPAFAKFVSARKELAGQGQRTIFNILGPLLNPAFVRLSVMGVFCEDFVEPLAQVLMQTGTQKALVFCGSGLDELSLAGTNVIAEIHKNRITTYTKDASDFGFSRCHLQDLQGGTPEENAAIARSILSGEETGPRADMVVLNAGAAIYVSRDDLTFEQAMAMARNSLMTGAAMAKLEACLHEYS